MSWSFSCVGKSDKVVEALEKFGATLTGDSATEFAEVKDGLIAIVKANHSDGPCNVVELEANGSATFTNSQDPSGTTGTRTKTYGSCNVNIKSKYLNFLQ